MKSKPDKCHLLVSTSDNVAIMIGNFQKESTKMEKVYSLTTSCLSIIIYQKLQKNLQKT